MTGSPMWKEFESGDGILLKLLRFVVLAGGVFVLGFTGILELTWPQQAVLGLLTGSDQREARATPIQHGPELLTILG